jgi:NAD-dependent SIR2 family protein deacetylase
MKYEEAKLEDHILICPQCGGNNLHQRIVTVFNRNEDGKHTEVTCVQAHTDTSTVLITDETTSNPSPRRHGMLIDFECEHCYEMQEGDYVFDKLVLAIYQHKGLTMVEWVK